MMVRKRSADGGPEWPRDSFRFTLLWALIERCPPFYRPKRGRKTPHQLAVAPVRSRRREAASSAAPRKARKASRGSDEATNPVVFFFRSA